VTDQTRTIRFWFNFSQIYCDTGGPASPDAPFNHAACSAAARLQRAYSAAVTITSTRISGAANAASQVARAGVTLARSRRQAGKIHGAVVNHDAREARIGFETLNIAHSGVFKVGE
jgi:hypothetical protein